MSRPRRPPPATSRFRLLRQSRRPATKSRPAPVEADDGDEQEAPPRSVSLKAIVLACLAVLILGGVAITFVVIRATRKKEAASNDLAFTDLGLSLKRPDPASGWESDDSLKAAFAAKLFGYARVGRPDGWAVGDARKFDYAVRPTDLKEKMAEQLNKNFAEIPPNLDGQPATLLGMPATKYPFRGLHRESNAVCLGEVTTLALGNVAVWVYCYAAEGDFAGLEEAFQAARAGLRRARKEGGDATVRFEKPYRSKSGLFAVTDSEGLWAVQKDPTTQDAAAELWLRGTAKGRKDGASTSDLVVAVLDPAEDPETHILKQMSDGYKSEPLTTEPTGDMPFSGELKTGTEVMRLKLRYPGAEANANKLIAYSCVPSGGKTVVAYAQCTLKDLEYWEQRMMQIVGSLKATK